MDKSNQAGILLKAVRVKRNLTIREVGEAIHIDAATISTYERGKRKPRRDRLIQILKALKARPHEKREIFNAYNYKLEIQKSTEIELKETIASMRPLLDALDIPTYLLDCTSQVIAWNNQLAYITGHCENTDVPNDIFDDRLESNTILDALTKESLLLALFRPDSTLTKIIKNWEIFQVSIVYSTFEMKLDYPNHQWFDELIDQFNKNEKFSELWELSRTIWLENNLPVVARPLYPLEIEHPKHGVLTFRASQEISMLDERFRVIYFFPANVKTMKIIEAWNNSNKTA